MLDAVYVALSLMVLAAISLPVGYVTTNAFRIRHISRLPFFTLLPLYLAVGVIVHVVVSYLLATVVISALVPLLLTISSIILILLMANKENKKPFFLNMIFFLRRMRFGNMIALIIIIIVFAYFARFPMSTQWPPVGDAIYHSMLTFLTVYKGHIATDLKPIDPFPYSYPAGYHVFSADLSLLLNFNSADAVYIFATYITILISSLLFTLTYLLTKSYWMSLPMPFVVLIAHNSDYMDRWITGYLANGTYPNLFAFMAIITAIVLAQILYSNRQSLSKMSTILIIILLALFVVYPQSLFHLLIFTGVYWISQIVRTRKTYKIGLINNSGSLKSLTVGTSQIKNSYLFLLEILTLKDRMLHIGSKIRLFSAYQNGSRLSTVEYYNYLKKLFLMNPSFFVLVLFIVVVLLAGLVPFYYRLLTFNVNWFSAHSSDYFLNQSIVLRNFLSDYFFTGVLSLAIVFSLAVTIFRKKIVPVCVGLLLLILSIGGPSIVYPERTLALAATLSWPVMAYAVYEFTRIKKIEKRKIMRYLIISAFAITTFYFEIPHIINEPAHRQKSGWFLTDINNIYALASWLKDHVNVHDLILNDRSYSSFYLQAFGLFNITHNYWTGNIDPRPTNLMPDASILREMNHLQNREYRLHKVPLPAVTQPIKNEFASTTNHAIILSYDPKPYLFLSGSNYTDIFTRDNTKLQLANFSVGVWFKTNATFSSDAYIVSERGCCTENLAENMNYGIWMTDHEKIRAGFESSNGTDYFVISSRSYNDDKWHYAVTTYDSFEIKLYVDGALVDRKLTSGALPDNNGLGQPIRIGANSLVIDKSKDATGYFTGSIYDVRVWNRPLVALQMQQELNKVWLYPYDRDLVYSLLKKYDVKYIVINSEPVFKDYVSWGGTGNNLFKPYSNKGYEYYFNSYNFLKLKWKAGNGAIYTVNVIK